MSQLKQDAFTIDYIYSLPDGQRAELIDGVVYDMMPPNRIHQRIISRLSHKFESYIEEKQGAGFHY